jgi:hypothetical protein
MSVSTGWGRERVCLQQTGGLICLCAHCCSSSRHHKQNIETICSQCIAKSSELWHRFIASQLKILGAGIVTALWAGQAGFDF